MILPCHFSMLCDIIVCQIVLYIILMGRLESQILWMKDNIAMDDAHLMAEEQDEREPAARAGRRPGQRRVRG